KLHGNDARIRRIIGSVASPHLREPHSQIECAREAQREEPEHGSHIIFACGSFFWLKKPASLTRRQSGTPRELSAAAVQRQSIVSDDSLAGTIHNTQLLQIRSQHRRERRRKPNL